MGGTLFLIGMIGLGAYSVARVIETRRGRRFFETFRVRVDMIATRLYRLSVFGEIPATYRMWVSEQVRALFHKTVVFLVGVLRAIERPLSRMNHRLRATQVARDTTRTPSPFLKTMVEAQKKDGESKENSVESVK